MTSSPSTRKLAPFALAILGGVLYFLGFVGFGQLYLEWICFVPVLFAIRGTSLRRTLLIGTVFGLATNMGGYYWVVHLLREFADLPLPLALLGYVLLCLYQGFLLALVLVLVRMADRDLGISPVWSLPLAFPALELVYPLLFPSYIGNSQYAFTAITQFVELTGMLGLTALIAIVNAAVYEVLLARAVEKRPIGMRRAGVALGAFAACLAYGIVRLPQVDEAAARAKRLKVAMIQTNLGSKEKHLRAEEFSRKHVEMSREAEAAHPDLDLIVWPESAYNDWIPKSRKNLRSLVTPGLTKQVVFGALLWERGPDGEPKAYNSIVLTSTTGQVQGTFDKIVLLAFGETIPLIDVFPVMRKWFPKTGLFTRGTSLEHLVLADGSKLLPTVCYEDIIPPLIRMIWKESGPPSAIVNVTNDSWYGDTHEPLIHLVLASFRAIETRRPMIRSTNTGISAIVDPAGRIVTRSGQWTREILVADVPMIEGGTTLYMRIGDAVGWAAVLACAAGLIAARKRRPAKAKAKAKA